METEHLTQVQDIQKDYQKKIDEYVALIDKQ